jgi:hypothetical protein
MDEVRHAIADWAKEQGAVIRMDRPLRHVVRGRHYHIAAPTLGTGTLEVNVVIDPEIPSGYAEVVCREHWAGTWAAGAMLDLVESIAADVGSRGAAAQSADAL